MRTAVAALITSLALTVAMPITASHAQGKAQKQEQKKVKSYDFSGDTIDGDLLRPDGDIVDTRKFASHTSLIRIRKDFIKEILKSAENL